jgi:non-heme chloroperoxidase
VLPGRSRSRCCWPQATGHRVITYDRRGFGKSSQPTTGYNYDTFAEDLHKLVTKLKLRDFALVGFSMGGGEVARYLGKYGSKDVSRVVFISAVPPFLLKTPDNPEGVDGSVFQGIQKAIVADRYAFFTEFFKNFYNADLLLGKRVSEQAVQSNWNVASGASAMASLACVSTWHEDFRKDLTRIDVPSARSRRQVRRSFLSIPFFQRCKQNANVSRSEQISVFVSFTMRRRK